MPGVYCHCSFVRVCLLLFTVMCVGSQKLEAYTYNRMYTFVVIMNVE